MKQFLRLHRAVVCYSVTCSKECRAFWEARSISSENIRAGANSWNTNYQLVYNSILITVFLTFGSLGKIRKIARVPRGSRWHLDELVYAVWRGIWQGFGTTWFFMVCVTEWLRDRVSPNTKNRPNLLDLLQNCLRKTTAGIRAFIPVSRAPGRKFS